MNIELHHGDCLDVMAGMKANSIPTIITDPPYGLEFMGKEWDHGVPGVRFWAEALRVATPGAMLLAFGGTRTHHRLMVAIEDAGWEIRDCLMWLYGSGFPKSHNISKAIDKTAGAEREVIGKIRAGFGKRNGVKDCDGGIFLNSLPEEMKQVDITAPTTPAAQLWDGWGTALKPAWEPIILAMKPLDGTFANNALTWGVAGLNVDGGRIATNGDTGNARQCKERNADKGYSGGWKPIDGRGWDGISGRFPANLILDETAAEMLDEMSGERPSGGSKANRSSPFADGGFLSLGGTGNILRQPDTGGASRFFYTAKASRSERSAGLDDFYWRRNGGTPERIAREQWEQLPERERMQGNIHPTVKPLSLMRYLVKLTKTPTGGVVLDMFAGSGTTACACVLEGCDCVAVEKERNSFDIMEARVAYVQAQPEQLELI